MGTFLDISACLGKKHNEVANVLAQFVAENDGDWQKISLDQYDDSNCLIETIGPNTLVMYPYLTLFCDEASQYLSETLDCTTFSLQIHDGDFWMFYLYHQGKLVTRFNTMPHYFEEIDEEELESWRPDIEAICRLIPGVSVEQIERYLIFWPDPEEDDSFYETKAYPDDEFEYSDWQIRRFYESTWLGIFYGR